MRKCARTPPWRYRALRYLFVFPFVTSSSRRQFLSNESALSQLLEVRVCVDCATLLFFSAGCIRARTSVNAPACVTFFFQKDLSEPTPFDLSIDDVASYATTKAKASTTTTNATTNSSSNSSSSSSSCSIHKSSSIKISIAKARAGALVSSEAVSWEPQNFNELPPPSAPQAKPSGLHLYVFVHGFQGCSWDLRVFRNMLQVPRFNLFTTSSLTHYFT